MRIALLLAAALLASCMAAPPPRSDEILARIQPGMPQAEVHALLGAPDNTMPFPRTGTNSWGYFYFDGWGYYCEFSVTFGPDGRVVSKLSRRVNDGGSRSGS